MNNMVIDVSLLQTLFFILLGVSLFYRTKLEKKYLYLIFAVQILLVLLQFYILATS